MCVVHVGIKTQLASLVKIVKSLKPCTVHPGHSWLQLLVGLHAKKVGFAQRGKAVVSVWIGGDMVILV